MADEERVLKKSRKSNKKPCKVRSSIKEGTVLILLSGRFRGKRVVCLKALSSGLLLVSGPYKVNGVPLKRVNQAYVIATSTTVDISKVKVPKHIDDSYFAKAKVAKGEREQFFDTDRKPAVVSDQRKKDQKDVDAELLKAVDKTPMLKQYLNAKFSLTKNDKPHEMVF